MLFFNSPPKGGKHFSPFPRWEQRWYNVRNSLNVVAITSTTDRLQSLHPPCSSFYYFLKQAPFLRGPTSLLRSFFLRSFDNRTVFRWKSRTTRPRFHSISLDCYSNFRVAATRLSQPPCHKLTFPCWSHGWAFPLVR